MNADGSDQRQITNHSANDRDPVWSPDGSQLAFTSDRDGDPEIWIVNADGGVAQQITNNGEALDLAPAWSPDGTRLLYYSDKSGGREIFLLDLASGSEIQLTSNNVYDGQPDWSLNGTQMVFAATRSPQGNGEPEIYISDASLLDANGDNATQLTDNPFLDDDPAWSPDGRQIVFESNRNGHLDIWIVNADGTGELQLTRDPSNDRSPDWIWKP
jgi:Tol biopolymer transport system component